MREAYQCRDMFNSFWSWPSIWQHQAFEMYIHGVLFVCLFICFACELVYNTAPPDLFLIYNVHVQVCVCIGGSNSWWNFGSVQEFALVLALSAFVFIHFVFVGGLYCLVREFVLSYTLQKCMEKNDLVYFQKSHTVGVMVSCRIGVLVIVQGSEYAQGESKSY